MPKSAAMDVGIVRNSPREVVSLWVKIQRIEPGEVKGKHQSDEGIP